MNEVMQEALKPKAFGLRNGNVIIGYEGGCYCINAETRKIVWELKKPYENATVVGIYPNSIEKNFKVYFCRGVEHLVSSETGEILDKGILVK
jgi:hypothetical protein